MIKKEKCNLQDYITCQAVNFDKLPWNRKDINFALFWPLLNALLGVFSIILALVIHKFELFDKAVTFLVVAVPVLYLCWKRYIFAMFIAIAWMAWIHSSYIIFSLPGFYLAMRVEQYRQDKGWAETKNWKKDIIRAVMYDILFIGMWLYCNVPFIWHLMTSGQFVK